MRALIFDCDGVLAETERDGHRAAFNRMFAAEGLDFEWTEDDYASVLSVAGGKERLRRLCTDAFVERHGLPTEQAALDELVALWHRRKTQIFLDLVAEGRMPSRAGGRRLASGAGAAGRALSADSSGAGGSVGWRGWGADDAAGGGVEPRGPLGRGWLAVRPPSEVTRPRRTRRVGKSVHRGGASPVPGRGRTRRRPSGVHRRRVSRAGGGAGGRCPSPRGRGPYAGPSPRA